jgi:hypothetical protein
VEATVRQFAEMNPATGPLAGPLSYPDAKIAATNAASRRSAPAINPDERSGLMVHSAPGMRAPRRAVGSQEKSIRWVIFCCYRKGESTRLPHRELVGLR